MVYIYICICIIHVDRVGILTIGKIECNQTAATFPRFTSFYPTCYCTIAANAFTLPAYNGGCTHNRHYNKSCVYITTSVYHIYIHCTTLLVIVVAVAFVYTLSDHFTFIISHIVHWRNLNTTCVLNYVYTLLYRVQFSKCILFIHIILCYGYRYSRCHRVFHLHFI